MRQDLDWEGASQDLDRACVIDAANEGVLNVRAILLATLGRTREAVELERRAVDLSPLNVAHTSNLAYFLATDGQYAEAREWARRSLEISPGNTRLNVLAYAALLTGKAEEALADFGRSSEPVRSAGIVAALHSLGREQESRDALARIERDHADEPCPHRRRPRMAGDLDGAFAELDRAIQERNPYLANVKNLPLLRPIRGDRRYAALLKRLNLPVDAGPTTAPPTTVAATPSIAVLPFADMSPKHDQEYFADGVAEEIRNALAQVEGLKVIGRTSSFAFKGKTDDLKTIGQKLGVANVLEGSLRKDGNGIRVTAQLIRVADGTHLWSESYDRKLLRDLQGPGRDREGGGGGPEGEAPARSHRRDPGHDGQFGGAPALPSRPGHHARLIHREPQEGRDGVREGRRPGSSLRARMGWPGTHPSNPGGLRQRESVRETA